MKNKSSLQKLKSAVLKCNSCIIYKPINNEFEYDNSFFPLEIFLESIILPNDKNADPFVWADMCIKKYKNLNPYVLIPGTQFDIYGGRRGRGGGWYDRFLSRIPKNWIRIGIIHKSKIYFSKISQKEWDEPIDWVIGYGDDSWEVYKTNARKN